MATLEMKIDASQAEAMLAALADDLLALKQVRKFPLDELSRLGDGLLSHLTELGGCTTAIARDDGVVIQVVGLLEIFAATVAALKRYVHKEMPQQS